MKTNNIFWISDVHGCAKTLSALIDRIPDDCEIGMIGDINDRGPDSIGAMEIAIKKVKYLLAGNHESLMIHAMNSPCVQSEFELWMRCGGLSVAYELSVYHYDDFVQRMKENGPKITIMKEYIKKLKLFYYCDDYLAVHANVGRDFDIKRSDHLSCIEESPFDFMLWSSDFEEAQEFAIKNNKKVIVGHHWKTEFSMNYGNVICIDTSCVRNGSLTAYNPLTEVSIHQLNIDL